MTAHIRHHPQSDLLFAYSTGSLNEAFSLLIACHVSLCDHCRAELEAMDALGGALLEEAQPLAPMSADALRRSLARIGSQPPDLPRARAPTARMLPEPLRAYVGGGLPAVRWRSVGRGVRQARLRTSQRASARLLYIPAGRAMPEHGHGGLEMTMVLRGAFDDGGTTFARGDVETSGPQTFHTPVAREEEDCICLAVTDAPLRFAGWLPRMVQPFVGI